MKAGFYHQVGDEDTEKSSLQSIEQLMLADETDEALMAGIKCVALAEDRPLVDKFTSYLLGEVDGVPKVPSYPYI